MLLKRCVCVCKRACVVVNHTRRFFNHAFSSCLRPLWTVHTKARPKSHKNSRGLSSFLSLALYILDIGQWPNIRAFWECPFSKDQLDMTQLSMNYLYWSIFFLRGKFEVLPLLRFGTSDETHVHSYRKRDDDYYEIRCALFSDCQPPSINFIGTAL